VLVIPIFFERENISSTDNYAGDCTLVYSFGNDEQSAQKEINI